MAGFLGTIARKAAHVVSDVPWRAEPEHTMNTACKVWLQCGRLATNAASVMYKHFRGDMEVPLDIDSMHLVDMVRLAAPLYMFASVFSHGILIFSMDCGCAFHLFPSGSSVLAFPAYCLQLLTTQCRFHAQIVAAAEKPCASRGFCNCLIEP